MSTTKQASIRRSFVLAAIAPVLGITIAVAAAPAVQAWPHLDGLPVGPVVTLPPVIPTPTPTHPRPHFTIRPDIRIIDPGVLDPGGPVTPTPTPASPTPTPTAPTPSTSGSSGGSDRGSSSGDGLGHGTGLEGGSAEPVGAGAGQPADPAGRTTEQLTNPAAIAQVAAEADGSRTVPIIAISAALLLAIGGVGVLVWLLTRRENG